MEGCVFRVLKDCIDEYNKYHSPEAEVKIVELKKNKIILKFSGNYCYTCGVYDYFEDFVYLLEEKGIKAKIVKIAEKGEGNVVEVELINYKNSCENLVNKLKQIIKNKKIKEIVKKRIKEFEELGKSSKERIFSELCFCILTANFNAEKGIMIQNAMHKDFLKLQEEELAKKLKQYGHRHPNIRAKYIVEARKHLPNLKKVISSSSNEREIREWFVKNVKGLGYKEASHFLRNIGFKNLAILDFHILDILAKHKIIEKPKTLTKKKYLEIEKVLEKIARELNLSLAELDLYLWYLETGKILK